MQFYPQFLHIWQFYGDIVLKTIKDFLQTVRQYRYDSNTVSAIYHALNNRFRICSYAIDSGFNRWCWHDKPEVLEEAMFRMIVDFVEREKPFESIDYTVDGWRESGEAVKSAYLFYTVRLPKLRRLESKCLDIFTDWISKQTLTAREEKRERLLRRLETTMEDEITHHLTQIVRYRGFLWT